MVETIEALFDGTVLRPDTQLSLEANTQVRVTVETLPSHEKKPQRSFLQTARSLKLEGPADWSANLNLFAKETGNGV